MADQVKIKGLILKYRMNKAMLSDWIGITRSTFLEKMNLTRYNKFTVPQQEKLSSDLIAMAKDILRVLEE